MAYSLEELRRLTETAGGTVADTVTQVLDRYHAGTLIGKGKIEELSAKVKVSRVKTVIFDENLSPAQQKTLEAAVKAKIIDRTRLILDIFARRARTKEGELQVELAQLSYMLPRLTGSWRAYSQQVGGIGTRGPGERQLEYERRHIHRRIEHLKRDIERMKKHRALQRQKRLSVPVPQAAIIGYTNVGKSTLLNALTQDDSVYADDKLFATLDPTSRRVRLPQGGWAVFTDTVGFIQKLPTSLVAAFRSTLEEAATADCLVHVMDPTSEYLDIQKRAVQEVLRDLKAEHLPCIEVMNKTDLLGTKELLKLRESHPEAVLISAQTKAGLMELLDAIQEVINRRWVLREVDLDARGQAHIQHAYQSAQVLEQSYHDGKVRLRMRITPENWSRLKVYLQ